MRKSNSCVGTGKGERQELEVASGALSWLAFCTSQKRKSNSCVGTGKGERQERDYSSRSTGGTLIGAKTTRVASLRAPLAEMSGCGHDVTSNSN